MIFNMIAAFLAADTVSGFAIRRHGDVDGDKSSNARASAGTPIAAASSNSGAVFETITDYITVQPSAQPTKLGSEQPGVITVTEYTTVLPSSTPLGTLPAPFPFLNASTSSFIQPSNPGFVGAPGASSAVPMSSVREPSVHSALQSASISGTAISHVSKSASLRPIPTLTRRPTFSAPASSTPATSSALESKAPAVASSKHGHVNPEPSASSQAPEGHSSFFYPHRTGTSTTHEPIMSTPGTLIASPSPAVTSPSSTAMVVQPVTSTAVVVVPIAPPAMKHDAEFKPSLPHLDLMRTLKSTSRAHSSTKTPDILFTPKPIFGSTTTQSLSKAPTTSVTPSSKPSSSTTPLSPSSTSAAPVGSIVLGEGPHCPYPYPGEHCRTKGTFTTLVTKAKEAPKSKTWCPYPGREC